MSINLDRPISTSDPSGLTTKSNLNVYDGPFVSQQIEKYLMRT